MYAHELWNTIESFDAATALGEELSELYMQPARMRYEEAHLRQAAAHGVVTLPATATETGTFLERQDAPIKEFLACHSGMIVIAETIRQQRPPRGLDRLRRPPAPQVGYITEASYGSGLYEMFARASGRLIVSASSDQSSSQTTVNIVSDYSRLARLYVGLPPY